MSLEITADAEFGSEEIKVAGCCLHIMQPAGGREWSAAWSSGPAFYAATAGMSQRERRDLDFATRAEAIAYALIELDAWLADVAGLRAEIVRQGSRASVAAERKERRREARERKASRAAARKVEWARMAGVEAAHAFAALAAAKRSAVVTHRSRSALLSLSAGIGGRA